MTKRFLQYLPALLLCLLPLQPVYAEALSDGEEIDDIVAIVNNSVITRSELNREIDEVIARFQSSGQQLPPQSVIEEQLLEKLIQERLQLDEAERLGITVTPDMLATAIGNIARKNGLTISQMRDSLKADGMSFKAFRAKLEKEIILSRLKNKEIISKISVSDAEIDNLLKQDKTIGRKNIEYRLQHILVPLPDGASPAQIEQAQKKTVEILQQLQNGADFERLAMLESKGRNALEGGNLGWLKSSQLPSIFADLVAELQPGEIAKPVRSSSGYHIVKLAEIRGDSANTITQTKARHILINTSEMVSDDDARTRLEQLHIRLSGGDEFEKLARSHSDDKGSAIKGGELGWVDPGSVVPEFQEVMDNLAPGEISKPFRTEFGWHIVQILDRRQYDNSEKVLRSEAKEILVERKSKDAYELYLRRLRDEAYVETRLNQE
jgi:peptidyl-prolyl cis-trans isomerase SurA